MWWINWKSFLWFLTFPYVVLVKKTNSFYNLHKSFVKVYLISWKSIITAGGVHVSNVQFNGRYMHFIIYVNKCVNFSDLIMFFIEYCCCEFILTVETLHSCDFSTLIFGWFWQDCLQKLECLPSFLGVSVLNKGIRNLRRVHYRSKIRNNRLVLWTFTVSDGMYVVTLTLINRYWTKHYYFTQLNLFIF